MYTATSAPADLISWSVSKADTAEQCLRKYKIIYVDKVKESSAALVLGDAAHVFLAKELTAPKVSSLAELCAMLDARGDAAPELYAMLPNIADFLQRWRAFCSKEEIQPENIHVENKYAINWDGHEIPFYDDQAYIRGILDLWAYDRRHGRLVVIDHKTSKMLVDGEDAVKKHKQLNLYCWMLTVLLPDMEWERAHIAINNIRHGKMIWSGLTWREVQNFGVMYTDYLLSLGEKVTRAANRDDWPATPGSHCNMCSFKEGCLGRAKR